MKKITGTLCLCIAITCAKAQHNNLVKDINNEITRPAALAPLRFLASDELMGRSTFRPEINIAAAYIREAFRSAGLQEVPGTDTYYQTFNIFKKQPAAEGSLLVGGNTYNMVTSLLQIKGADTTLTAPVVYAKYGTMDDLANIDVKGKIVITELGENNSSSVRQGLSMIASKRKILQEKGAIALIERYKEGAVPWSYLQQRFTAEMAVEEESTGIPVLLIKDDAAVLKNVPDHTEGILTIKGTQIKTVPAKNVVGWVEGTDPILKNQFVALSAHYDHLGVAKFAKMEDGKLDSIYNGARDNAIGVTAVINAATYFAKHPPKRSVLFIAYTGEEIGEIGSKYYAEHPPVPLKQIVYNLNIDNAGYNDTSIVTVVGLGRTSADNNIKKACAAFGLKALPDPAPEQNLFDRSDNVNLAVHGIPAPTFSLGISQFDEEINKRYHQLSDEVGNFNLNYAIKYIHSFILAAQLIADDTKQPEWIKGDKYEAAWKQLYKQPL